MGPMTSQSLRAAAFAIVVLVIVLGLIIGIGFVATPPSSPPGSIQPIPSASGT